MPLDFRQSLGSPIGPTSMYAYGGCPIINDFDVLLPELNKNTLPHNWWTIDLCFWPDAWQATALCKEAVDELNVKYGG